MTKITTKKKNRTDVNELRPKWLFLETFQVARILHYFKRHYINSRLLWTSQASHKPTIPSVTCLGEVAEFHVLFRWPCKGCWEGATTWLKNSGFFSIFISAGVEFTNYMSYLINWFKGERIAEIRWIGGQKYFLKLECGFNLIIG